MSVLFDQIKRQQLPLASSVNYLSYSRLVGNEVVIIENRRIKIVNLVSGTFYLDNTLDFDPTGLCGNANDDLLCLYDNKKCCVVALNSPGSQIVHTAVYSLQLKLQHKESVLQVIFNRVSKLAAELVVLTTESIHNYDINSSLTSPTHMYLLRSSSPFGNSGTVDVIDPVSIAFGSAKDTLNPCGDLTLSILTSDLSIYKIYPYLPANVSVSQEWMDALFDYATMKYNSSKEKEQEVVLMLKFVMLLSQTNGSFSSQSSVLPANLSRGRLSGPLSIQPFPDELYEQDALKLIPLENNLFAVLLNKALVVLFDQQDQPMAFENQNPVQSTGVARVVDCLLFGSKELVTGFVHPSVPSSLVLTTSVPEIVHVDFSSWWSVLQQSLESNDFSGLASLINSPLPTKVDKLGTFTLPAFRLPTLSAVPLATNEHKVTLIWNSIHSYAVANTRVYGLFDEDVEMDGQSLEPEPLMDEHQYTSPDLSRQLRATKNTLLRIQKELYNISSNQSLQPQIKDMNQLYKSSELVNTGLVSVFRTLATTSQKLELMRREFKVQIATLGELELNKTERLAAHDSSKRKLEALSAKQSELDTKVGKLLSTMETIYSQTTNSANAPLTRKETAFAKQLQRMNELVADKEQDLKAVQTYVDGLKDTESVPGTPLAGYEKELARMKHKLDLRTDLIQSVAGELKSMKI
ncbi:hypothetical protein OGAPHI_003349 [Ogataea philodendri]|uniref:Uncharacterized protein n=1 Tax=Ogataea philodendri TaxID=1378263 RepID=A0A9P8P914_9ASCO|nr:uncharacterized protein OGAPHI_003349 [Ogataea philodendri]KAH3666899.1 hypothetical protein OGAPHI_003349 [Ogataea philodendri]